MTERSSGVNRPRLVALDAQADLQTERQVPNLFEPESLDRTPRPERYPALGVLGVPPKVTGDMSQLDGPR